MDLEKLKADIHKKIDAIDDELALQMLQEATEAYVSYPQKDILDELTEDQLKRLKESEQQIAEGKGIPHEEVQKKVKEWLSR
jgi:predicted transcriptional regulator